ncbi:MAG: serine/threonine protein kinase [Gallionellales bacterium 35-53-114]|jgi:serine/threonine protein kinase|nr:MAG: serine/threonine protein kinase [Gallionellales bacterium 35-53-114]OYZ63209.1 MAG: serine/threonine protein kinase [Gallionellales bacterium 24-53-125]OZB08675.1 MAG: serine/threonine protein kinase [Gallionellales bacterium 39-52-133]HQS57467.1 HDOD domain-containing protein [Gallionellaceae bacterium]HQS74345.1 HDOD domain-containing protein [Gallionellaceae bacterium]
MAGKLIGRFEVIKELGRGAQGVVYLARDPRLDRQVAIKTLRTSSVAQSDGLLREAKTVSNLQHPNIIPLYDLGSDEGSPYLVYAFIDGETVAQVLKRTGPLSMAAAARILADVLEALASAHSQGIMHLDIKPANVMISSGGQHLVMDFGIARTISQLPDASGGITGTPQYMAPETISAKGAEFRSDIFSAGVMLYEMVTGAPVVEGGNAFQILNRNAHEKADAPSSRNIKVDEKLEWIILKAIAKKPEERFPTAQAMRQALLTYLDSSKGTEIDAPDADFSSTLRFLLRRMRSKSDFPALSGIIHEINKIVSSESEGSSKLAQAILQDFSLTNKLLKLVNTVSYSQFGGQINTISKAVSILGFESVRNIAMSLILMDFIQNKSQAQDLKDDVISSFFSGIVAVQLSEGASAQEVEETMICAMFLNLGRMIAKFYFFEESEEITRMMEDKGVDEDHAAMKVLGVSYNELGIGIAKTWNFPDRLIAGMQKIKGSKVAMPAGDIGRMSVTVNMANELCSIATVSDPKGKKDAMNKIRERYSDVVDASEERLSASLEKGLQDLSLRSQVLGIDTSKSVSLKNLRSWLDHVVENKQAGKKEQAGANGPISEDLSIDAQTLVNAEVEVKVDPEATLSNGIQDVTNTLVGEYKLNDVLQMVLETIYRGLGFKHVIIFSRDVKQSMMVARFGFGENVSAMLPLFRFPLAFEADVFHLALQKELDIVIEDVGAPNIATKIPAWHSRAVDARYFLLLPVVVNKIAVGLIYADMQDAKTLQITPKQLSMLRTLRNQAVLAIKQKA